ncbi:Protein phosphatase 1 regulatory subunit 37 [Nymphon striatum]|nr:Protein phosphatase 1 regulatory subunit 37 [Nymphon striatum]
METPLEGQEIPQRKSHSAPQSPTVTPPTTDSGLGKTKAGAVREFQRRVSFPDDEYIVTSYLEPPVPWLKSDEMSPSDIIDSYKLSCVKHRVEPIDVLLAQIEKIQDFSKRFEELDLSDKKLDAAQCESLEEIFKRIQFNILNLQSCCLDDEASLALFDMLEFYEVATALNISYNKDISSRGWHACSRMLKKTPCLENLNASNTNLNEIYIPIICRALRLGSNLSVLRLDHCNITGKTFVILVAALKMNTTLSELYLEHNSLSTHDGYQLGSLLRANIKLKLVNLNSNALQDSGISFGIEGLADQPVRSDEGLKSLILKNNSCSSACMGAVSDALRKTTSLEYFDLSNNDVKNDGIYHLKDGLMKNRSLLNLNLQCCKISCEGAIAIAEYIADNTFIQGIDLRGNDIKLGGYIALSLSMKVNTSITSMKLDLPQESKASNGRSRPKLVTPGIGIMQFDRTLNFRLTNSIPGWCLPQISVIYIEILDDENLCEYQQLLNDISNFCIRNRQMIEETSKLIENSIDGERDCGDSENDINSNASIQLLDIKSDQKQQSDQIDGSKVKTKHASNGRFQVSRVQSNPQPIPKYVSGKTNGRFTVFKVNSVCEEPNEGSCENISETKETLVKNSEEKHNEPVQLNQDDAKLKQNQISNSKDLNHDVKVSDSVIQEKPLNKIKEFVDFKFRLPSNFGKRRVTIEGSAMPNVQKIVQNVKSRRKSTPAVCSNNLSGLNHQNRPALKLSLNKRLECLDLRSTVPLSPGRRVESCGLPMSSVDAMLKMDETLQVVVASSGV